MKRLILVILAVAVLSGCVNSGIDDPIYSFEVITAEGTSIQSTTIFGGFPLKEYAIERVIKHEAYEFCGALGTPVVEGDLWSIIDESDECNIILAGGTILEDQRWVTCEYAQREDCENKEPLMPDPPMPPVTSPNTGETTGSGFEDALLAAEDYPLAVTEIVEEHIVKDLTPPPMFGETITNRHIIMGANFEGEDYRGTTQSITTYLNQETLNNAYWLVTLSSAGETGDISLGDKSFYEITYNSNPTEFGGKDYKFIMVAWQQDLVLTKITAYGPMDEFDIDDMKKTAEKAYDKLTENGYLTA